VLDTSTYFDLAALDPSNLPAFPELTAVTLAELHQGVAMARDPAARARRAEKLAAASAEFDPLPFDAVAAARYGTLVALLLARGHDPRPRWLDMMIAAISSTAGLPLYIRNPADFVGLESAVTVAAVCVGTRPDPRLEVNRLPPRRCPLRNDPRPQALPAPGSEPEADQLQAARQRLETPRS
jgi:predicted nucleic acid-binding protein